MMRRDKEFVDFFKFAGMLPQKITGPDFFSCFFLFSARLL